MLCTALLRWLGWSRYRLGSACRGASDAQSTVPLDTEYMWLHQYLLASLYSDHRGSVDNLVSNLLRTFPARMVGMLLLRDLEEYRFGARPDSRDMLLLDRLNIFQLR
eukprot:COSAG02_NODE_35549_length_466_cov_1.547684_1_plen_106_part_01